MLYEKTRGGFDDEIINSAKKISASHMLGYRTRIEMRGIKRNEVINIDFILVAQDLEIRSV